MTNAAHFLSNLDAYVDAATRIISLDRQHLPANVTQALDIAEQELSSDFFDSPSDAKSPFHVITLYLADIRSDVMSYVARVYNALDDVEYNHQLSEQQATECLHILRRLTQGETPTFDLFSTYIIRASDHLTKYDRFLADADNVLSSLEDAVHNELIGLAHNHLSVFEPFLISQLSTRP